MFISWRASAIVSVGTTIGFFLAGFPPVIVLRAATHIIFAVLGALYLKKVNYELSPLKFGLFSLSIGVIHALAEVFVVSLFYFGNVAGDIYYQQGFLTSILLLVGLGTVVHSVIDLEIARFILAILRKHNLIPQQS